MTSKGLALSYLQKSIARLDIPVTTGHPFRF